MSQVRQIKKLLRSKPTIEGAGVHLKRAFGFHEVRQFDPFLLLDDFRSDNPDHYLAGFPWHPHRGIETNWRFLLRMSPCAFCSSPANPWADPSPGMARLS